MQRGKLVIMSGPSAGAGKDTILKMFLAKHPDWYQPPSTTTRQLRAGEIPDKDMKFVSRQEFENWLEQGKFLETDYHADNWYGTLLEPVVSALQSGKNVILRIDVNGALTIKGKMPEAILVFVNAENLEALKQRINARNSESEDQIQKRLELARYEITLKDKFDVEIINKTGEQEEALKKFEQAIL